MKNMQHKTMYYTLCIYNILCYNNAIIDFDFINNQN